MKCSHDQNVQEFINKKVIESCSWIRKSTAATRQKKERPEVAADRMQPHMLTGNENNPRSNRNVKPMKQRLTCRNIFKSKQRLGRQANQPFQVAVSDSKASNKFANRYEVVKQQDRCCSTPTCSIDNTSKSKHIFG